MDHVTCPRCRTSIQPADGTLRCPGCGGRLRTAITAEPTARPNSTEIATGLPASAAPLTDGPASELDRLTARSRRWRYFNDHSGGGGDDADCHRIGSWFLALRLLPFIIGAILLLLVPAAVFGTLTHLDPETVGLRNLLIFTALIAGPAALGAGFVWWVVRRNYADDEDASC